MATINWTKWNEKRTAIEARIRELKAMRTESHQPRWGWKGEQELAQLKSDATALYAMRAHRRRAIHAPDLMRCGLLAGQEGTREQLLVAQGDFIRGTAQEFEAEAPAPVAA